MGIIHIDLLSPVFLAIGPFKFHYYGLMYALSFVFGYWFLRKNLVQKSIISEKQLERMLFGTIIFGIIGGRLGEVLFYNIDYFINHPIEIFYVWNGGMASHGGFILGFIGFLLFKPKQINSFTLLDLIVIPLALGLALGRFGNLINGELYGYVTDLPWCMKFADGLCRHPTQIYAIIKDLFIFFVLIIIWKRVGSVLPGGFIASTFLILYGILRFIVEYFKEDFVGNNYFNLITTGQILSLIMIFIGVVFMALIFRRNTKSII